MAKVRRKASRSGQTITAVIEGAIREMLGQDEIRESQYRMEWIPVPGRVNSGVDLTNRDRLVDIMEGR